MTPKIKEDRQAAHRRGHTSETLAALWLRLKGYRILARRLKTHAGEIDLVAAAPFGPVCFVEVKARAHLDQALLALNPAALRRVSRAARLLAGQYAARVRPVAVRIDAVLVVPRHWPHHIEAVWQEAR